VSERWAADPRSEREPRQWRLRPVRAAGQRGEVSAEGLDDGHDHVSSAADDWTAHHDYWDDHDDSGGHHDHGASVDDASAEAEQAAEAEASPGKAAEEARHAEAASGLSSGPAVWRQVWGAG